MSWEASEFKNTKCYLPRKKDQDLKNNILRYVICLISAATTKHEWVKKQKNNIFIVLEAD